MLERNGIKLKLLVGAIEVGLILFVFPAEATALPDIRKTASAINLGNALFKGVAVRICSFVWRRFVK